MIKINKLTKEERKLFKELYTLNNLSIYLKERYNTNKCNYELLEQFKYYCFIKAIETINNLEEN